MPVIAGIDEAGYGPLLGPLVISSTAFRLNSETESDLWERFGKAITRSPRSANGKVCVADSKIVHKSGKQLTALEENLLPFLGLLGDMPTSLNKLVDSLVENDYGTRMKAYPWYCNADPCLPRHADQRCVVERMQQLDKAIASAGGAFCGARVEILDVIDFNYEVGQCNNKALPLAQRVGALMRSLWETFGKEGVRLAVDKLGGRNYYEHFLLQTFPFCSITAKKESPGRSEYVISNNARRMHVTFEPQADRHHMPTALASMLSKYTRELLIEMFNDFWVQRIPNLRRTAGYYSDGQRFLRDIEPARHAEGIQLGLLLRCR